MEKSENTYEDFINMVDFGNRDFVDKTDGYLKEKGFKAAVKPSKQGYVVSYTGPGKKKGTLLNYVFRKSGLIARIYANNLNRYDDILKNLPQNMAEGMINAPVCKRLMDPAACSSRCPMGYQYDLNGEHYKKCRYSAFMFLINGENEPFIREFIEKEAGGRSEE